MIVAKDGDILLEKSYGYKNIPEKIPLQKESQFCIGSITKQITSLGLLKLVEQKKISLEDKIKDLVPEFLDAPWAENVTVRHLLTHTSGTFEPTPLEAEKHGKTFSNIKEVISYLSDKPSISTPGKLFLYSNHGYLVLGYLMEKITQKSLELYLKECFFDPLGMHSTYLQTVHLKDIEREAPFLADPHAYKDSGRIEKLDKRYVQFPFSAGGIISTTQDLLRWNRALYGNKLVSKHLLMEFLTPHLLGYGLGITIETFANGDLVYKHGGAIDGYHSLLLYLPKQKVTVCALTNVDYHSPHRMEALTSSVSMMFF